MRRSSTRGAPGGGGPGPGRALVWIQVRPYRTGENKIDGVVLTWVDIHALKRGLEQIRDSRDYR